MTESAPHQYLLMLSNPVEGRDEEFRKWYWGTHIPEILELPVFVSARRWLTPEGTAMPVSHRYATVYEVEGSAEAALGALYTAGLSMSDSMDLSTAVMLPFALAEG